jgi:hypothetical protein
LSGSSAVVVTAEGSPPGPEVTGGTAGGVGGLYSVGGNPAAYRAFVGQTFTAGISGDLYAASFSIVNNLSFSSGNPLMISLSRLEGGIIGQSIATAEIPFADVPLNLDAPYQHDYTVTAFFTSGPQLTAGENYALTIDSQGELGSNYWIWLPNDSNSYAGGQLYENTISGIVNWPNQDLFFRVQVDSIPETSSAFLGVLAGAGACFIRRARRR